MLVEKKSWKNLIKPVLKYLGIHFLFFFIIFIFVKFSLPSDDFGIKHIVVVAVSALFAWLLFVLELCNLEKDFHQIVKVDDLITIEIQNDKKKYFSDIMKYINDSNVIPSRIKESLKEDILKTYTKDHPLGERFTT